MKSLKQAAGANLRLVPPMSVRSVADHLGVPPRSTLDLMYRLGQDKVSVFSGSLLPSSVKGTATLVLCSDGFWEFRGHVHDNGFIKHSYGFGAAPHVVDADLNGLMFANQGSVTDSRDDDFVQRGWDQRVSQHWDKLRAGKVSFELKVKVDPITTGDLLGLLLITLSFLGAIGLFLLAPGKVTHDPDTGAYRKEW